jgi:5-methylcytosine-specific restriction endonuclease McrA
MKQTWIPLPIRRQTTLESKGICALCGKKASKAKLADKNIIKFYDERGIVFEIDHIQPLYKGGKTVATNLRILCASCNRRRKKLDDKTVDETDRLLSEINS